MNILLLTNLFPPDVLGGYELLALDIVEGLRTRGHTVTVLTSGKSRSVAGEARILRLVRPFSQLPRRDRLRHLSTSVYNGLAIRRYLKEHGLPDSVLTMSLRRLGLEPLRQFQKVGLPIVMTVNDDWPIAYEPTPGTGLRGWVGARLDRMEWFKHTWRGIHIDRVVYVSESIRNEVRQAVKNLPKGIVCFQGVNTNLFAPRAFHPISDNPTLLFVGRLHPTKAPDVAIDVLTELRHRGVAATLKFAGVPVTESYGTELERRLRESGMHPYVEWLGQVPRDRLGQTYCGADIMLFLSRWEEPLGLTYMEAMASGVPVVSYPLGGAKEFLDAHSVDARANACTGDALANTIIELMRNLGRQRELYDGGLKLVREQASLDNYVDVLVEQLAIARRVVSTPKSSTKRPAMTITI